MTSLRRRRPLAADGAQVGDAPAHSQRARATLVGEVPRVRRYATAWLGSAAAADHVVRSVIEQAIAQGALPDEPQRLRVHLLRLLHGLAGEAGRLQSGTVAGWHSLGRELAASAGRGEEARAAELMGAIEQLSNEHRQALLLIALEGLAYREAADVLGLPLGTVMSRLAGAREQLLASTGARTPDRANDAAAAARAGVSELDMYAHHDGELGAERTEAVEAFLRAHPEQRERLASLAEWEDLIRKLYNPILNRPAPPELLAPLLTGPDPIAPARWPKLVATAAAGAALLGLGCLAGWLLRSYFTPAGIVMPWLAG